MNAPRPLLSDPTSLGGSEERSIARALLESGREVAPPPGAKDLIWSRLEAGIAAGAVASASVGGVAPSQPASPLAGAAPAKKGVASLATKLGLAGILAGGALVVATFARAPSVELAPGQGAEPASFEGQLPSVRLVSTGQMPEAARDLPTAKERAVAAPVVAHDAEKVPSAKPNPLREVEGVRRARAQLAAGDTAGALEELAALDREVDRSTLGQERQVLTIEALAASGQQARASQLAKAFLAASPDSPYAKRVAPFAAP